jgi:hypothetical protein
MKKFFLTILISVPILVCSNCLQAQNSGTKLNQVELIKQFINNWMGEVGKDTTVFWEIKLNGTGLECNFRYVSLGKMIMEGKQIWEYDQKVDKFILSSITGMDSGSAKLWFTSKNKCIIQFSDISSPGQASIKIETEFKSPDTFTQKTIVNNNIVKTDTYSRVKN